jgi:uncharacterized protein (TIGR03382 family)
MRTGLLLLLAMPASALAQAAGVIAADTSAINLAQCTGAPNGEIPLDDKLDVGLQWTVAIDTTAFTAGGLYRIFVANEQPAAGQTAGTSVAGISAGISCTQAANTASTTFRATQLGSDIDAVQQSTAATRRFALKDIVSTAGFSCTDQTSRTVYLCVQWYDASGAVHGWATATLPLDLTPPAAPTGVSTSPADGSLHVNCSAGDSSTSTFKARATAPAGAPTYSNQASSCGDLVLGGLANGQTYTVVVFGMDAANNPSPASAPAQGQPVATDDFWTHYKNAGGRDQGGCSSAGAAGVLGALAALVLLRRRRR